VGGEFALIPGVAVELQLALRRNAPRAAPAAGRS